MYALKMLKKAQIIALKQQVRVCVRVLSPLCLVSLIDRLMVACCGVLCWQCLFCSKAQLADDVVATSFLVNRCRTTS